MNDLIPPLYTPPHGLPLHWGNEQSGVLRAAVMAYLAPEECGPMTPDGIDLVRQYLVYHVHAPAWLEGNSGATANYCVQIGELQQLAAGIRTIADITRYLDEALKVGIDPL